MEYISPLWTGTSASNLAQIDVVETKAFRINGISHAETELMWLSLSSHRYISDLSVFDPLISGLAPSALSVHPPNHQVSAGLTYSPPSTPFW